MKCRGKMSVRCFSALVFLILMLSGMTVSAASVRLSRTTLTMTAGTRKTLYVKNSDQKASWSVSKKSVLEISETTDSSITVFAKKAGTSVVKANIDGKTYSCKVTVKKVSSSFKGYQWGNVMYLSGNDEIDYMAEVICQKVLGKPGSSVKDTIRKLYEYLACFSIHYAYCKTNDHTQKGKINFQLNSSETKAAIASYALYTAKLVKKGKAVENEDYNCWGVEDMMITGSGVCSTTAAFFRILLGHVGIKCLIVGGASTTSGHTWNAVKYGSYYYFCDADSGNYWWYTIPSWYQGSFDFSQCMFGTERLAQIGYTYYSTKPKLSRYYKQSLVY